jgi:hypothetical protein
MRQLLLKFDLPEDQQEAEEAQKAGDYQGALFDFSQHLRSKLKHGELSPVEFQVYEEIREKFWEILRDWEVEL